MDWSLADQVAGVAGLVIVVLGIVFGWIGKFWRFVGWIGRRGKPLPVVPTQVVIVAPPAAEPAEIRIGLVPGRQIIGREREVVALGKALEAGGRVVLAGPGGMGKSSLARHFAQTEGKASHGVVWTRASTRAEVIGGLMALEAGRWGCRVRTSRTWRMGRRCWRKWPRPGDAGCSSMTMWKALQTSRS